MKPWLRGVLGCWLLTIGFPLHAQTNAPAQPPSAQASSALSFLTPAEQLQYAKARAKALADNPDLKAEGEKVAGEGASAMSPDATAAEKQAFIEKMNMHRQKLRAAMLKEDSSLEPIFAEIDQHISEMKAKHLGQVQSSTSPNTTPPKP